MNPHIPKPLTAALLLLATSSTPAGAQDGIDRERYLTPPEIPVRALDAEESFAGLTEREKLYAHWMSVASWLGCLITFEQVSAESPEILELVLRLAAKNPVELRKAASRQGVGAQAFEQLEVYSARFLSNAGNYLSFGDTKFIPRLSEGDFSRIVRAAAKLSDPPDERLLALFADTRGKIYSLGKDERQLGLGEGGTSNYYAESISPDEAALVKSFMVERGIEAWNTRLFEDEQTGVLELRIASACGGEEEPVAYQGRKIAIRYGDHATILEHVIDALSMAYRYAANDHQRTMIQEYILHFTHGDIADHKEAMRAWVKDVGPVVETNLGFIETYRDPLGVRAEWEGFVAVVNKEQTRAFSELVARAPASIARLPWPAGFEKDEFRKPDFTSLDVIAFANSGIPGGINIPNYDEIRQNEGFKNVSLGNVLSSGSLSKDRITFVEESEQEAFRTQARATYKVQVGLHELLGHGSGKLLRRLEDGSFNFDRSLVDPTTGKPVASWYEPGQTWGSVFSGISSAYEECRAEAVGLYLSLDPEVLAIFGHEGEQAALVTTLNWLLMARSGLAALQFYNPEGGTWGQAHMWARYVLMRVMLDDAPGLLKIYKDDAGDWLLHLDRAKIATVGKKAMGAFLEKLNVYKATANQRAGRELFRSYSAVDERMLAIREYGLSKRKPRHIWVQAVTDLDVHGNVIMRTYPATYRGVIDSFLDRYSSLAGVHPLHPRMK